MGRSAAPHLLAALGYYRAQFGPDERDPALADEQQAATITPPQATLYLHGSTDSCVAAAYASAALGFLAPDAQLPSSRTPGIGCIWRSRRR
jgi:hypothetical protein